MKAIWARGSVVGGGGGDGTGTRENISISGLL